MDEQIQRSVSNERLIATLSAALSTMATLLSVIGLYGVMAYMVTRRTREIGIRMALGALGSQVAAGVLREASLLVGLGLGFGSLAAWGLSRYVRNALYGVTPADPTTIAFAAMALLIAAAVASLVPAGRAVTHLADGRAQRRVARPVEEVQGSAKVAESGRRVQVAWTRTRRSTPADLSLTP